MTMTNFSDDFFDDLEESMETESSADSVSSHSLAYSVEVYSSAFWRPKFAFMKNSLISSAYSKTLISYGATPFYTTG
jgi:hypothetical protein